MLALEIELLGREGAATATASGRKKLIGKVLSCHRSRRQVAAQSVGGKPEQVVTLYIRAKARRT